MFGSFFDAMKKAPVWGGSEFGVGPFFFGLTIATQAHTILEIGCYKGFSTLAFAGALKFLDDGGWVIPECQFQRPEIDYDLLLRSGDRKLVSLDLNPQQEARDLIESQGLSDYVQFEVGDSHTWEKPNLYVDILLIDGDHTYEGAKHDFQKYVTHYLKPGGYVILHDYFGWYDLNSKNQSPIARIANEQGGYLLIDTGFMSFVLFRKAYP